MIVEFLTQENKPPHIEFISASTTLDALLAADKAMRTRRGGLYPQGVVWENAPQDDPYSDQDYVDLRREFMDKAEGAFVRGPYNQAFSKYQSNDDVLRSPQMQAESEAKDSKMQSVNEGRRHHIELDSYREKQFNALKVRLNYLRLVTLMMNESELRGHFDNIAPNRFKYRSPSLDRSDPRLFFGKTFRMVAAKNSRGLAVLKDRDDKNKGIVFLPPQTPIFFFDLESGRDALFHYVPHHERKEGAAPRVVDAYICRADK